MTLLQNSQPEAAVYQNGFLTLPKVSIEGSRTEHRAVLKLISEQPLRFEVVELKPPLQTAEAAWETLDFRCNVCGEGNRDVALLLVMNREAPSCAHCGSSLRMRSIVHVLSTALFEESLTLPEFPADKTLRGAGMSDWEGYAKPLAGKFGYTNTFYHTEPHLDILDLAPEQEQSLDFLISSDVFEHIPPPVSRAFDNSLRLLKPGGLFLVTVPFGYQPETLEHFPELFDFHLVDTNGKRFLHNKTRAGEEQIFDDLIFHGGDGFTLEMRFFSERDLCHQLRAAGFRDVQVHYSHQPEFGIIRQEALGGMPVTARRQQ